MRFYTEYLWLQTQKRREYINITEEVEKAITKSGISEGMVLVSAMHVTKVMGGLNGSGIQSVETPRRDVCTRRYCAFTG